MSKPLMRKTVPLDVDGTVVGEAVISFGVVQGEERITVLSTRVHDAQAKKTLVNTIEDGVLPIFYHKES